MSNISFPELIIIFFVLTLMAVPAILSFIALKRIPERHRKQKPAMCFLLMIPFFSMVWQFFVYPRISKSLQSYYCEQESRPPGDMGASLALWCCICTVLGLVPVLGLFAGIASLILMVMFFIKVYGLSRNLG